MELCIYKINGLRPNKFTYLNTFVIQLAHRCSDNGCIDIIMYLYVHYLFILTISPEEDVTRHSIIDYSRMQGVHSVLLLLLLF